MLATTGSIMDYQDGGHGGFMQGSPPQGSQGHVGGKERGSRPDTTVTAVSIFQLMSANQASPEDPFVVDGLPLGNLSIVGVIREVDPKPTKINFRVEDHTGVLDMVMWVNGVQDDEFSARMRSECREGMYVHVYGEPSIFAGKRQLVVHRIHPIADFNEITHHQLEIIHTHLVRTRGSKNVLPQRAKTETKMEVDGGNSSNNYSSANRFAAPAGGQANGFSREQNAVLSIIQRCPEAHGVNVQALKAQLPGMDERQIRQALDFLSNEGHVYSTIDDDHFKSTDSSS